MSVTDDLVGNNAAYADARPEGALPGPPSKQVAVVACMDARIDVYRVLGLADGEAHVIRNAGGVVSDDVIRSLTISQRKLGTREIVLIHHTQCGMATFDDAEFRDELAAETGSRPTWHTGAFSDLDQDVRDGIQRIHDSPFVAAKDSVRGFVLDVATGRLREVS